MQLMRRLRISDNTNNLPCVNNAGVMNVYLIRTLIHVTVFYFRCWYFTAFILLFFFVLMTLIVFNTHANYFVLHYNNTFRIH